MCRGITGSCARKKRDNQHKIRFFILLWKASRFFFYCEGQSVNRRWMINVSCPPVRIKPQHMYHHPAPLPTALFWTERVRGGLGIRNRVWLPCCHGNRVITAFEPPLLDVCMVWRNSVTKRQYMQASCPIYYKSSLTYMKTRPLCVLCQYNAKQSCYTRTGSVGLLTGFPSSSIYELPYQPGVKTEWWALSQSSCNHSPSVLPAASLNSASQQYLP